MGTLIDAIRALHKRALPVYYMPPGYLRASGLAELCPREACLYKHAQIPKIGNDADQDLNYELGGLMHHTLQNGVLRDVLWGIWRCSVCGHVTGRDEGFYPQDFTLHPGTCAKCAKPVVYQEITLLDRDLDIGGHTDGFVYLQGQEGLGVLEIKTVGSTDRATVKKEPLEKHVVQVMVYLALTGLKWAVILYWDKALYGFGGFNEHIIQRDETMIQAIRENIVATREAIAAWTGENPEVLPPRICEKRSDVRARKCPASEVCFGPSAPIPGI